MPEAWYALYTKFQHEKSAAALLAKKNLEVLLPVYRAVHRWKDRKQTLTLPLFPCYMFVRMDLDRKLDVVQTPGIRWLIENAGRACPVPDVEIEAVQRVCSDTARVQPHPFLQQGDLVRVLTGALSGMEGILTRTKNQYRIVISVQLLQKSIAVEIDAANVVRLTFSGARGNSSLSQVSA
jgi:transcription antitermination factor NusG